MTSEVLRPEAAALVADAKAAGMRVGALTNDLAAFHGDDGMADDPSSRAWTRWSTGR